jgi:hypothetical protein
MVTPTCREDALALDTAYRLRAIREVGSRDRPELHVRAKAT